MDFHKNGNIYLIWTYPQMNFCMGVAMTRGYLHVEYLGARRREKKVTAQNVRNLPEAVELTQLGFSKNY